MTSSTTGLRERKKAATRAALTAAALRLAAERGADRVTTDDIAAAAGVSPRTFFNYFTTKEEAFVADDVERAHRFVAEVAAAPDDAPLWELLHGTALRTFTAGALPSSDQALKEQLVRTSPAVLAEVLGTFARLEQELVDELTRRARQQLGSGPGGDLHPRLLAAAVGAAVRAATQTWLAAPQATPDGFLVLLDEAFSGLAPCFPHPIVRHPPSVAPHDPSWS